MAQRGLERIERGGLIGSDGGLREELPELLGRKGEAFQSTGEVDTEGASTAMGGGSVVAEDTIGSDGLFTSLHRIVATQEPMSNEESDLIAMRAWD